jgi:hypothetical protein
VPGWPPVRIVQHIRAEHVWGGLRLHRGRIYVPVASYCDKRDPKRRFADGRLVAVGTATRRIGAVFDVVPGPSNLGGIWGWGGVSVDPAGQWLFTATGNSVVRGPRGVIETAGYGERIVRLTPGLRPVESHLPQGIPTEHGDTDFGATPLLFDPPGCPPLAAAHSKNGFLYVWDRYELRRGPLWSAPVGPAGPEDSFIGQPSYSPALAMLFVAQTIVPGSGTQGVTAFRVEEGCRFVRAWGAATARGPQPPPIVVGDVVFSAAGEAHELVAYDARTGQRLWAGALGGAGFAPPIVAGDLVVAADSEHGRVRAFGLP